MSKTCDGRPFENILVVSKSSTHRSHFDLFSNGQPYFRLTGKYNRPMLPYAITLFRKPSQLSAKYSETIIPNCVHIHDCSTNIYFI